MCRLSMATAGEMALDCTKSTPRAVNHSCSAAVSVRFAQVCIPKTRAICTTAVMAAVPAIPVSSATCSPSATNTHSATNQ